MKPILAKSPFADLLFETVNSYSFVSKPNPSCFKSSVIRLSKYGFWYSYLFSQGLWRLFVTLFKIVLLLSCLTNSETFGLIQFF